MFAREASLLRLQHFYRLSINDSRRCSGLGSINTAAENGLTKKTTPATSARPFEEIPGPSGLPYFGTYFSYKNGRYLRYYDQLVKRYKKYGKIYKETVLGETRVHIFDPDDVTKIFRIEGKYPRINAIMVASKAFRQHRNMSPGLTNSNGKEEWYPIRHALSPVTVRRQAVTRYVAGHDEVALDFVDRLKRTLDDRGHSSDFDDELKRWNLESSGKTFLERRLGCLDDDMSVTCREMIDAITKGIKSAAKFNFSMGLYNYIRTPVWFEHIKNEDESYGPGKKIFDEQVTKMMALAKEDKLGDKYSYLSHAFFNTKLSYEEIQTNTVSFFVDGQAGTVSSIVYILYALANAPDVQDKLYEHIKEVLPDPKAPITPEDLQKMSYLKACIKEAMRMIPSTSELIRTLQQDLVLQDYHIPAGTTVDMHMNVSLRQEEYVTDPDQFIPERWIRDESNSLNKFLRLPFGHGSRMCLGRRLVEQEQFILVTRLIQNFRIRWPHSHKMWVIFQINLMPDCEPDFHFEPRRN